VTDFAVSRSILIDPQNLGRKRNLHRKRKWTNFRWPSIGIELPLRTGPIPTAPGGWGLRNPEPKGPGQRSIFLSQPSGARGWRKWGSNKIPLTIP
jgi:hypothetical protein